MELVPHPAEARGPVRRLGATAERAGGALDLVWRLTGDLARIRVPAAPGAPVSPSARRADGLWRHTCFEAFVAVRGQAGYCELNFAPSGGWAAYRFDGYRAGMRALALATPPQGEWRVGADELAFRVALPLAALGAPVGASLELALAAVVEAQSGTITHWALRHPPGPPDFHHRDAFACELAGTT
jgi:hypothetical protein